MRKSLFVFVLFLSTSPVFAQEWRERRYAPRDNQSELTIFTGYRWGGTIYADTTNLFTNDVAVKSASNYGVNFAFPINQSGMKVELLVDRQDTNFTRERAGLFTSNPNLGRFHVTYYQAGIVVPFAESRAVTPYAAVSFGLANLDPELSGASTSNRFAASAGVGLKVPVNRNLALKVEARGYFTSMDDHDFRCGSCYNGSYFDRDLYQGETSVGVAFRF
jgi:hypothetical protein